MNDAPSLPHSPVAPARLPPPTPAKCATTSLRCCRLREGGSIGSHDSRVKPSPSPSLCPRGHCTLARTTPVMALSREAPNPYQLASAPSPDAMHPYVERPPHLTISPPTTFPRKPQHRRARVAAAAVARRWVRRRGWLLCAASVFPKLPPQHSAWRTTLRVRHDDFRRIASPREHPPCLTQ